MRKHSVGIKGGRRRVILPRQSTAEWTAACIWYRPESKALFGSMENDKLDGLLPGVFRECRAWTANSFAFPDCRTRDKWISVIFKSYGLGQLLMVMPET